MLAEYSRAHLQLAAQQKLSGYSEAQPAEMLVLAAGFAIDLLIEGYLSLLEGCLSYLYHNQLSSIYSDVISNYCAKMSFDSFRNRTADAEPNIH